MTATAERVLEEIKSLPEGDLRVVWREVTELVTKQDPTLRITPAPRRSREEVIAALDRLACIAGGVGSLQHLLDERARDFAQEEGQLQEYLAHRRSAKNG
jgi:phosphoenolpyruvate synthase/pyruvate phosphate dikinase